MKDPLFTQQLITKHEGFRARVYPDSDGKATIGIGFNLDDPTAEATCQRHGLSLAELLNGTAMITYSTAQVIRDEKIANAEIEARGLIPNWDDLPADAQAVVADMLYNMGDPVFEEFHGTIAALKAGNCKQASVQMKNSAWYREVGSRGVEDVSLMESAA